MSCPLQYGESIYQKALKFTQRMFYSNKRPWRRGPSDMYMSLGASTPVAKEREEEEEYPMTTQEN